MRELSELVQRLNELDRRVSGMIRQGRVTDVDPAKQLVRLEIGRDENGQPVKGPWVPYAQHAGALKLHTPPSVGQQMTAISPSGDPQQATAMPFTWSGENSSPSQAGNEHVLTFGSVRLDLKAGSLKATVGGTTFEVSASGVKVTAGGTTHEITGGGVAVQGGQVTHDGKNVGSSHTHTGVEAGGAQTGAPA